MSFYFAIRPSSPDEPFDYFACDKERNRARMKEQDARSQARPLTAALKTGPKLDLVREVELPAELEHFPDMIELEQLQTTEPNPFHVQLTGLPGPVRRFFLKGITDRRAFYVEGLTHRVQLPSDEPSSKNT